METEPFQLVGGALLFVAAAASAGVTTRGLLDHRPPAEGQPHAVQALMWLLCTTVLAIGAASLWARPGLELAGTWPVGVALLTALAPLITATIRRMHPPTRKPDPDGRPAT